LSRFHLKWLAIIFWVAFGIIFPLTAFSQEDGLKNRSAFSFYLENDFFAGTDRYYTHGVKMTWISPDKLSSRFDPAAQRAFSVSFGQNIYTPADIEREELIEDDRPYAGVSFFSLGLHRKKDQNMDTLEFLLGIVGPSSFAAEMQRFIHGLYRGTDPRGWHHQLKDEIVFNAIFDRKKRIVRSREGKDFGYDLIAHLGGSLGNMMIAAVTGWQFRIGWNIPKNFGTFLLRPGGESSTFFDEQSSHRDTAKRFGFHSYIYVAGHSVFRNIFLDGNTFRESHRVDKYSFVADIIGGVAFTYKRFKFSYAYVFRTKQFKTQAKPQVFGAINISLAY